jgi:GTP cyclohydrolase I
MTTQRIITWGEVIDFARTLPPGRVYGVPRGGAALLGVALACNDGLREASTPDAADYILDDIIDSGRTMERFAPKPLYAMVDKRASSERVWVVFPWEHPDRVHDNEDTVVRLLELIGEDPSREGLRDTPRRHIKAMLEMTEGYKLKAEDVLKTTFDAEGYDELVVLKHIEFTSLCEHHLLPFSGTAAVAYLPGERIVGLSKLARLVEMHARRLQVQERMTSDIANDIQRVLGPRGVAVVVQAHHSCMGCRGVRKPTARMVTSAMRGTFLEKAEARAEVLSLFG